MLCTYIIINIIFYIYIARNFACVNKHVFTYNSGEGFQTFDNVKIVITSYESVSNIRAKLYFTPDDKIAAIERLHPKRSKGICISEKEYFFI